MRAYSLENVQGLDRIAARILSQYVERMHADARRKRAERLAAKWGARLVVAGEVKREGGAR